MWKERKYLKSILKNICKMSYICLDSIGLFGERLGSQMNNFAAIYTAAKETGHTLAIERNKLNAGTGQQMILDAFEYPFTLLDDTNNFKIIEIEEFAKYFPNVEKLSIHKLSQNINYKIVGRLDNGHRIYFNNAEQIQNNLFKFKSQYLQAAQNLIKQLKTTNKQIVSLHFRRTDYLTHASYCLTLNYYREALSFFNPDIHCLLLFSDDTEFCKTEVASFLKTFQPVWDTYYIINNSFNTDMCLMSMCDHNIIANSCFSFWAALLNKNTNKQVIYPKNWFDPEPSSFSSDWISVATI